MRKTAIVTGASGNMGQAICKKFIEEGYDVIGTVMANEPVSLDFMTGNFRKVHVDLTDEEAARQFINGIITDREHIDVAVLTVGGFAMGNIADTSTADINRQVKLNFDTAYNIARPVFIQMMKQNQGRVFLISSRPGIDARNGKGMIAYSLAKSLIFRLAELMNEEARGTNVVTSVIVPSTIDTPVNREAMPGTNFDNWVKTEQIADVIYFYSGNKASSLREPVIRVYNNS